MKARLWLVIWVALIVVVGFPWTSFGMHPYWSRVQWIPFVSPPVDLPDVVGNVLFFVPYGLLVGEATEPPFPIAVVVGSAILLSVTIEFTQIFSASRFPSTTDVVCNVLGAFIGARWALRRRAGRSGT